MSGRFFARRRVQEICRLLGSDLQLAGEESTSLCHCSGSGRAVHVVPDTSVGGRYTLAEIPFYLIGGCYVLAGTSIQMD